MKKWFLLFVFLFITPAVLGSMQIFARMPSGKTITLDVDSSDSIANVKAKINAAEGYPPSQQRLFFPNFAGQELENNKTLGYYNITTENTIWLYLIPYFTSFFINQSTCLQGDTLVVSAVIQNGTDPLDKWWFKYNDTVGNLSNPVNGSNTLLWHTFGLSGNYSVQGHLNDTSNNTNASAVFYVLVETTTSTSTTTTTSTTTSTSSTSTSSTSTSTIPSYTTLDMLLHTGWNLIGLPVVIA